MKGAEHRIGTIIEAAAAAELKLFNVCSFKTPLLPGQAPTIHTLGLANKDPRLFSKVLGTLEVK